MIHTTARCLLAGLLLTAPAWGFANPITFTMTIDGVDPSTPPAESDPHPVRPGMFVGLGDCSADAAAVNHCTGSPPVSNNPLGTPDKVSSANAINGTNLSNAAIYGYGLPLDQVIFHAFSAQFTVTGGVIDGSNIFSQAFDFIVGNTGGGSNGLGNYTAGLFLARTVRIVGTNGVDVSAVIAQEADLTIGTFVDTLQIFQANHRFDLGPGVGFVRVVLSAEGPVTEGDPGVDVGISLDDVALPLPSTLPLLGLGLAVMGSMRRWRR